MFDNRVVHHFASNSGGEAKGGWWQAADVLEALRDLPHSIWITMSYGKEQKGKNLLQAVQVHDPRRAAVLQVTEAGEARGGRRQAIDVLKALLENPPRSG